MNRKIKIYIIILFLVPMVSHASTPKRIVSLKPNITELLFAIGAGDQVVGVTTWCDRPEAAKKLPKVSDYIKPNVEKILALRPDLIVASQENSIKGPFKVLENLEIPILYLSFKTVDDLLKSTTILAEATGHQEEGSKLADSLRGEIERRRKANQDKSRPKTLIVVGKRPLVAAGKATYLSELIEIAGGKNIIGGKITYPHINMETVIARDPDVIINLSMGSENSTRGAVNSKLLKEWDKYNISAVKNNRVYSLDISDFRIGPNLPQQIQVLRDLLK